MKTKEQIIQDQESIGNEQITREEWYKGKEDKSFFMIIKDETLYFRPKKEKKNVFEDEDRKIEIYCKGLIITDKLRARNIYFNESMPLLLEAIEEGKSRGFWK